MARKKTARRRAPSATSPSKEFKQSYPATTEGTEQALRDIMQAFAEARLSCGDSDEIQLALREALNNAVRHGSGLNPEKKIHIACRCGPKEGLWVMVRDEGEGFDPNRVPDPTSPENLERYGGRGVYMLRKLMDKVEYQDGGREVHLWRRTRSRG